MKKKQNKKTKIPTSIEDYTQYEMLLGALQPDGERQCGLIRKGTMAFNPMPEDQKIASIVMENINNPQLFIESIKENPELILDDEATQATLRFLRWSSFDLIFDANKSADRILKACSLEILIPKKPKRQPDSQWISYWRVKRLELDKLVNKYETEILSFADLNKTWKENEPEFKQYYQDKYKRTIPKKLLHEIKVSGSKTDIALLLISDEYAINYPSLRKLYYTSRNKK